MTESLCQSVGGVGDFKTDCCSFKTALAVLNYILRRLFYSEAQIIDITIDCPCKNKHVDHIGYSHRLGFELVFFLWFIAELRLGNIREITHPLSWTIVFIFSSELMYEVICVCWIFLFYKCASSNLVLPFFFFFAEEAIKSPGEEEEVRWRAGGQVVGWRSQGHRQNQENQHCSIQAACASTLCSK